MAVVELWGTTWVNLDWTSGGTSDYGLTLPILLRSVRFSGAANDKLTIMQAKPGESDSSKWPFFTLGPLVSDGQIAMSEPIIGLSPKKAFYYVDYSKSTFATPANNIIQFVFE